MTEQEPDPPDVDLAILAGIHLLRDLDARLDGRRDKDLRGRVRALRGAYIRLHAYRHPEGD